MMDTVNVCQEDYILTGQHVCRKTLRYLLTLKKKYCKRSFKTVSRVLSKALSQF